jgi:pimeloyl-ACP methyl ester carboxylesterase
MSKVYLIAGLGADPRIYKHIVVKGCEAIKVEWITPNETDTLETYAQKLINQYSIENNSIVIGNSLGGMLAIEIAKKIRLEKVILISSIRTTHEAPPYFKLFRAFPLYKIIPSRLFTSMVFLIEPLFGKMNQEDKWLFRDMLKKTSPVFLRWAMGACVKWDNEIIPPNTFQISSERDLVFPLKYIKDSVVVKGGSHVMIFDKADEINKILKSILENETSPVVLSER